MKALDEIKVSVYENVYSKKPKIMSFLEVIILCIHPTYATIVNAIRGYFMNGDREAAQKMKSRLPCFTPAGTFDGAHAIKQFLLPSHIIGLDYDHVPNRLEIIKTCSADPHTVAVLESPTDGVKIFAYVEDIKDRHREAQQLVSNYYDQLLRLKSDPACKDESRLCYFTYSPNGYVAGLYEAFVLPATAPEASTSPVSTQMPSDASEEEIQQFLSSYIFLYPLVPGQRHTNLFKLACEACRRGYPQKSIFRRIAPHFEGTDFSLAEINSVLKSSYQQVESSPSISKTTNGSAISSAKPSNPPYSGLEMNDDPYEAYIQGEEYRKHTPCFPKEVYENLPDLLNESINEDYFDREKDIALLSTLTALSAAMPQTFGIYNKKKYTPHIFCIVIAPAANSKSCAQVGRHLLQKIHQSILTESIHQYEAFEQRHNQWKVDFARLKKTGGNCPVEPKMPPFKILFIPATTSYSRMLAHIKDNADQGGIIFDTEIDSFTNANKRDCGNFDNLIRKSAENEDIDSSYKINGIIPLMVKYPILALFLTGTPGQVDELLTSSENGMVSRILLYTYREQPHWKEMGDSSATTSDIFEPLAEKTYQLYQFCLRHPMLFRFTNHQWAKFNSIFSHLLDSVALEGNDDLQAVVKRYAFMVMRLSMVQSRIRQFEKNDHSMDIYCDDVDFERSLQIILSCYQHSRLVVSSLPAPTMKPLRNPDIKKNFIDDLPDTFTTQEAKETGAVYGFSGRKVERLLTTLIGLKFKRVSKGKYSKIP